MGIIFFEGEFVAEEEIKIPLSDRGFQFGDGAFAVVQVNDGVPLFLQSHLQQLHQQCASFNLIMPPLEKEIIECLIDLNQAQQGIWRLKIVVTGGDGEENFLPQREGRLIIYLKPFHLPPFKRLNMAIFSIPYSACHAFFKSLAHLNRFYVMEEARRLGLDDGISVTEGGVLLEAAFGNLFWIKEKTLYTSDPSLPLYFGITIKNVIAFAQKLGFQIEYIKWTLSEIPPDGVAFRTNTMQGVRPIAQIGERFFAENMTTQNLFVKGYASIVQEQKKAALLSAVI